MALTPDDRGYWLVAQNGQVYSFGDAKFYGPRVKLHLPSSDSRHCSDAVTATVTGWSPGTGRC